MRVSKSILALITSNAISNAFIFQTPSRPSSLVVLKEGSEETEQEIPFMDSSINSAAQEMGVRMDHDIKTPHYLKDDVNVNIEYETKKPHYLKDDVNVKMEYHISRRQKGVKTMEINLDFEHDIKRPQIPQKPMVPPRKYDPVTQKPHKPTEPLMPPRKYDPFTY